MNDTAPDGTSALNMAAVNAYFELAMVLLDHGALDPNAPDPARVDPAHIGLAAKTRRGQRRRRCWWGVKGRRFPTEKLTSLELAKALVEALE